jgi:malate synthase
MGHQIMYDWGAHGWCRAIVTDYYSTPKTKQKFNYELTYPKTDTTAKEIRNHALSLRGYGSQWFALGNSVTG